MKKKKNKHKRKANAFLWKDFETSCFRRQEKNFPRQQKHLNFTCVFRGTMKRISQEFYGDLSGNRCTKVSRIVVPQGCQYI